MPLRALITGIAGQDGSYLSELLLEKGYEVHGLVREQSAASNQRLGSIRDRVILHGGNLFDQESLLDLMRESEPDEIYNLAAVSVDRSSWEDPVLTAELIGLGVTRMLEAMRQVCPSARFCQASSSEMFGEARETPQNELTPFHPRSPYGVAKLYGHFITCNYRERYGLHACSGILFNHESPRRSLEFVTRKVTHGAAAIKRGEETELRLGNLDARRDWGYAPDYVDAMWRMLQQAEADDYVIGTGRANSVGDLVNVAFACVGLDPSHYVVQDPAYMRPAEAGVLIADPSKAREKLGWAPATGFEELIALMVDADLQRIDDGGPDEAPR